MFFPPRASSLPGQPDSSALAWWNRAWDVSAAAPEPPGFKLFPLPWRRERRFLRSPRPPGFKVSPLPRASSLPGKLPAGRFQPKKNQKNWKNSIWRVCFPVQTHVPPLQSGTNLLKCEGDSYNDSILDSSFPIRRWCFAQRLPWLLWKLNFIVKSVYFQEKNHYVAARVLCFGP